MSPVPKLVAFDLDGTLWDPEMYQLRGGAPFRRDKQGRVFDSRGEEIHLIGESLAVLRELATDPKWKDTQVAYVSRTEYPEWAVPCLKTFMITESLSMWDVGRQAEIYPGSKRNHFRAIKDKTGTPYNEMLFFDNERWNITDCAPLGITCVYCRDGMTPGVWAQGLQQYTAAVTANAGATS